MLTALVNEIVAVPTTPAFNDVGAIELAEKAVDAITDPVIDDAV